MSSYKDKNIKKSSLNKMEGHLDLVSSDLISGWYCSNDGNDSVSIVIDDMLFKQEECSQYREDLKQLNIRDGNAGFSTSVFRDVIEKFFLQKKIIKVDVEDPNTGFKLIGSPALFFKNNKKNNRLINIFSTTFFTLDGKHFYHGGAERYLIDLCKILMGKNIVPVIYQASNMGAWEKYYKDIKVVGVPVKSLSISEISQALYNASSDALLNIYSPFPLAVTHVRKPSIGISHGVYWDCQGGDFLSGNNQIEVLSGIIHVDTVVSVDTNTINFIRSIRPDLINKFKYIPNYVGDEFFDKKTDFFPKKISDLKKNKEIVVCYPRRLYNPRGLGLIESIIPAILEKYNNVEFWLVGGVSASDQPRVIKLLHENLNSVKWFECQPSEMPHVYKKVDISLIPTVHSEGTSLSALEAMASGNAVIATNVGGLTDIVIDDFNGLLINPTENELHQALIRLLDDKKLRLSLGDRAKFFARFFRKEKWEVEWFDIIQRNASIEIVCQEKLTQLMPAFIFMRTDGISWSIMKQRPQHLARALATLGLKVYFCSDTEESEDEIFLAKSMGINLINPGAEIHVDHAIAYTCYAFHAAYMYKYINGEISDNLQRGVIDPLSNVFADKIDFWFDLLDDVSIHNNNKNYIDSAYYCLSISSHITFSAMPLHVWLSTLTDKKLFYVPNAVFPDDFKESLSYVKNKNISIEQFSNDSFILDVIPFELLKSKLCIVYYGAIAEWFDFDVVEEICKKQNRLLIIAGPVTDDVKNRFDYLIDMPNVFYLGVLDYLKLPILLKYCDIGLIPFKKNKMTDSVLPVKLFEYLASGLRVVTSNLDAIEKIETSFLDLAAVKVYENKNDVDGFIDEINQEILEKIYKENYSKISWVDAICPFIYSLPFNSSVFGCFVFSNQDGNEGKCNFTLENIYEYNFDLVKLKNLSICLNIISVLKECNKQVKITFYGDAVFYNGGPILYSKSRNYSYVFRDFMENGLVVELNSSSPYFDLNFDFNNKRSRGGLRARVEVAN